MLHSRIITKSDFTDILRHFHYKIEKEEFENYYNILCSAFLTKQEVFDIFRGANKKYILTEQTQYAQAEIGEIIQKIVSGIDIELYKKLAEIDSRFKLYAKRHGISAKNLTPTLRQCWHVVKKSNDKINQDITEITKNDLEKLEKMAMLYNIIAENVPDGKVKARARKQQNGKFVKTEQEFERIEDFLIGERLSQLKASGINLILSNITNVDKFLQKITSEELPEKERFTKEEIKDILDSAITILGRASLEKYNSISLALNEYYSFIRSQAQLTNKSDLIEASKDLTVKEFIKKVSTIVNWAPESFKFSLGMFQGGKIKDVAGNIVNAEENVHRSKKIFNELVDGYPELHFQPIPVEMHLQLLKKAPSDYAKLTPMVVLNATDHIVDSVLKSMNLYQKTLSRQDKVKLLVKNGFDINNFYNADNIHEITMWEISFGKKQSSYFDSHIQILSQYVKNKADVYNIMAHNFSLFRISDTQLQDELKAIQVQSCGDARTFNKLFNNYINTRKIITQSSAMNGTDLRLPNEKSEKFEINIEHENIEIDTSFSPEESQTQEKEISFEEKLFNVYDALWNMASNIKNAKDPHEQQRKLVNVKAYELKKDYIIEGQRRKLISETIELLNEVINSPEFDEDSRITLKQALDKAKADLKTASNGVDEDLEYLTSVIDGLYILENDKEAKEVRGENVDALESALKSNKRLIGRTLTLAQVESLESSIKQHKLDCEDLQKNRQEAWGVSKDTISGVERTDGLIHLYAEEIKTKASLNKASQQLENISIEKPETKQEEETVEIIETEIDEASLRSELEYWIKRQTMKKNEIQRVYGNALKRGEKFREEKNINYRKLQEDLREIEDQIKSLQDKLNGNLV